MMLDSAQTHLLETIARRLDGIENQQQRIIEKLNRLRLVLDALREDQRGAADRVAFDEIENDAGAPPALD